jgi:hypothetical protein
LLSSIILAEALTEAAVTARASRYNRVDTSILMAEGTHKDYATPGAWWKVVREVIAAGLAADVYYAEVLLSSYGIAPPMIPYQRWILLRDGDLGSPGTRSTSHLPPASDSRPAPGWSPADRLTRFPRGQIMVFANLWQELHGDAEVRPEEIHPKFREALAGRRGRASTTTRASRRPSRKPSARSAMPLPSRRGLARRRQRRA